MLSLKCSFKKSMVSPLVWKVAPPWWNHISFTLKKNTDHDSVSISIHGNACPSSFLKEWGPMILLSHRPHQTIHLSECIGNSWTAYGLSLLQIRQYSLLNILSTRNAPHHWREFCDKKRIFIELTTRPIFEFTTHMMIMWL